MAIIYIYLPLHLHATNSTTSSGAMFRSVMMQLACHPLIANHNAVYQDN